MPAHRHQGRTSTRQDSPPSSPVGAALGGELAASCSSPPAVSRREQGCARAARPGFRGLTRSHNPPAPGGADVPECPGMRAARTRLQLWVRARGGGGGAPAETWGRSLRATAADRPGGRGPAAKTRRTAGEAPIHKRRGQRGRGVREYPPASSRPAVSRHELIARHRTSRSSPLPRRLPCPFAARSDGTYDIQGDRRVARGRGARRRRRGVGHVAERGLGPDAGDFGSCAPRSAAAGWVASKRGQISLGRGRVKVCAAAELDKANSAFPQRARRPRSVPTNIVRCTPAAATSSSTTRDA